MRNLHRDERTPMLIYLLLLVLGFSLLAVWLSALSGDFQLHWWFAYELAHGVPPDTPHMLYQVLLIAVKMLLPGGLITYLQASAVVTALAYASMVLTCYHLFVGVLRQTDKPQPAVQAARLALAMMFVGPFNLITGLLSQDYYWGYVVANAHHNPTSTLLKPMALLLFLGVLRAFVPPQEDQTPQSARISPILIAALTVLGVVSSFAKPNFTIALLPALVLFGAWWLLVRRGTLRWGLLLSLGISLGLIVVLQSVLQVNTRGGIELAPLRVAGFFDSPVTLLFKVLLSLVFPLFVTAAYFPQARRDTGLLLAWLSFGCAYVPYLLFSEPISGNWLHGNFIWGPQITAFILCIMSTRLLAQQPGKTRAYRASLLLLLVHVLCGALLLLLFIQGFSYFSYRGG